MEKNKTCYEACRQAATFGRVVREGQLISDLGHSPERVE